MDCSDVATVILAGGQGSRLYPLTMHHAKPSVSYGGRYRLIDIPISNAINSHLQQVFVIAQYLSSELSHHIQQTYSPNKIEILTPLLNDQGEKILFEGTADAVRKNLSTLLQSKAEYFLILSGDQLYNMNFQPLLAFAKQSHADLTICSLPIKKREAFRMGLLKINENNDILEFVEKPTDPLILKKFQIGHPSEENYLGSMGIYVFKRDSLIRFLKEDPRSDFGHHLIQTVVTGGKAKSFVFNGYWEDIGTIHSYYEANLILTEQKKGLETYDESNPIFTRPTFLPGPKIQNTKVHQSVLCEGSIIEAEEISHCIIGLRSQIKKGTILRKTVLMGNHCSKEEKYLPKDFWIGENCHIENAIIDEHVRIGNNVKLINKNNIQTLDLKDIYIRDGIIIVTRGAIIPDYFEL